MTSPRFRRVLRLVGLLVLIASVAACGDDDPELGDSSDTTTTSTSAPPDTTTTQPTSAPSTTSAVQCSAGEVTSALPPAPELPAAVTQMREQIRTAATACDYDQLEMLALAGSGDFTFSFGSGEDPSDYWRTEEQGGARPLLFMAELLARSYGTAAVGGETAFVWPSASTHPSWDVVPAEAQDELRPLYDDEDFADFSAFGSYIGYRIGITESGDWIYFVAGD